MRREVVGFLLGSFTLLFACSLDAQQSKIYRVGIVREGGPDIAAVEGLKEGLKELGLIEGTNYAIEMRDLQGNESALTTAGQGLERANVDVIYSISTSVTLAVKRATSKTPIVFAVGSDPVGWGLVETFAKPGGRFTGVYYSTTDLTAKRFEILTQILPALRKVATIYFPSNPLAVQGLKSVREVARQLHVEVLEIPVTSTKELRAKLAAFNPRDADAFFYVNDAMVRSDAQFIVDTMRVKKVPTMFSFPDIAAQGALAGYGVNFREVGRLSARYVQKILAGASPANLPVETVSRMELVLNAKTARDIGVTIPQAVRLRASEVVE